ncbi:MAG: hypothetical protein AAGH40_02385 [Verrucomicrobiota bacterium]
MKKPWRESSGWFPYLYAFLALLIVGVPFKTGHLTLELLGQNKDVITAVTSLLTFLLVSIGGAFTYFKFFKGRLLSRRLNIDLTAKVFNLKDFNNLCIDIILDNVGLVSLWDLEISVDSESFDLRNRNLSISKFVLTENIPNIFRVIDPGEKGYEQVLIPIPKDSAYMITKISIQDRDEFKWNRSITVKNIEQDSGGNA